MQNVLLTVDRLMIYAGMGSKSKPNRNFHALALTIVQPIPPSVVIQEAIKIFTARLCLVHSF